MGLIGWIRGERVEHHLGTLSDVATRLERIATTQPLFQLWWVVGAILEALRDGGLEGSVSIKRLLGLADRGHLKAGAAADIAVYREQADREAMFKTPEYVFKDGVLVARGGSIEAVPTGGTHFVEPDYDRSIEKTLRKHLARHGSVDFEHIAISHDELCSCCNGGRLLPAACFAGEKT